MNLGIDPKTALLIALTFVSIFYVTVLVRRILRNNVAADGSIAPTPGGLATGFVTNFFDTLGIGSFATTTAIFRKWKMIPDEKIPGTLNVGHTIPTIAQAFIFTKLVPVDPVTLVLMIVAAVGGSIIGAGVVSTWPRRRIQIGMGTALVVAAFLMLMAFAANVGPDFGKSVADNAFLSFLAKAMRGIADLLQPIARHMPKGGTLLALTGSSLAIGMVGNFVLGALMPLGIGLYGPCMLLIYMLGMDPAAAFPIMMGSCAFLMPAASTRLVNTDRIDMRTVIALAVGGLPAVLIAAYLVKSMPLDVMRVLVVIVVLYTAIGLLRSARRDNAVQA